MQQKCNKNAIKMQSKCNNCNKNENIHIPVKESSSEDSGLEVTWISKSSCNTNAIKLQ